MSMVPSFFGRRSNVFDLFSLDVSDPFFDTFNRSMETAAFANTSIDWKETPEAHKFKADLPGLKVEVKVEMEEGGVLQISGERAKDREEKSDRWHRVERSSGRLLRRLRLPENAEVEQGKAATENGVVIITVPKRGEKKPQVKSVEISGID